MKKSGYGAKGHIAIGTNSVSKAVAYLERNHGVELIADSVKKDADGNITFAYLKEEVGGFAIHLFQKK
jgi:2-dehydro-3-deoxyphosphogluconate aldolase/(4S)-4-hydroxy-2-oxoglutarate aldolase